MAQRGGDSGVPAGAGDGGIGCEKSPRPLAESGGASQAKLFAAALVGCDGAFGQGLGGSSTLASVLTASSTPQGTPVLAKCSPRADMAESVTVTRRSMLASGSALADSLVLAGSSVAVQNARPWLPLERGSEDAALGDAEVARAGDAGMEEPEEPSVPPGASGIAAGICGCLAYPMPDAGIATST